MMFHGTWLTPNKPVCSLETCFAERVKKKNKISVCLRDVWEKIKKKNASMSLRPMGVGKSVPASPCPSQYLKVSFASLIMVRAAITSFDLLFT